MINSEEIKEGQIVKAKGETGSGRVGTVDHLEGSDYIKLKRSDSSDGQHHWIPTNLVDHIESDTVYLSCDQQGFENSVLDESPR